MSHTHPRPKSVRRAVLARSAALPLLLSVLVMSGAVPASAVDAAPLVPAVSVSSVLLVNTTGSGNILLVRGELPTQTPLPARLELPIPSGSTPSWVGEILGSNPAQDPTAQYTTRSARGYDIATLTLKQSRLGQVELSVSAATGAPSTSHAVALPVLGAVRSASVAFEVPTGSTVSSLSAGLTKARSSGGSDRYSLTRSSPRPGTVLTGSLVVAAQQTPGNPAPVPGAAAGAPTQNSGSSTSATDVVLWLMLLGAVVFFLYNAYRFSQVRSERIAAEAGAPSTTAPSKRLPSAGGDSNLAAVESSAGPRNASRANAASLDADLKRLQNLRSQGAMSRQEFLKEKSTLLDKQKH